MRKIDRYRMHLEGSKTTETIDSYCFHVNHLLKTYPNADKFTYNQLLKVKDKEKHRGSFRVFIAAIRSYYQYLYEKRYRNDNPAILIKTGKRKRYQVQHQDLISREDLESLLNAREERYAGTKERNQVIISFLIYQGLRSQELVNLKVSDVDLYECVVKIRKTSSNVGRVIELKPKQIGYLTKYLEHRSNNNRWNYDALLIGVRHKPYTVDAINGMIKQFDDGDVSFIAGKKINATTIRQSVISNWLNVDGKSISETQLLAGHKYPSSTLEYRREDPEEKRKLINQFHPFC